MYIVVQIIYFVIGGGLVGIGHWLRLLGGVFFQGLLSLQIWPFRCIFIGAFGLGCFE